MRGDGLVGIQDDMLEVETVSVRLLLTQRGRFLCEILVAMDRSIMRHPSKIRLADYLRRHKKKVTCPGSVWEKDLFKSKGQGYIYSLEVWPSVR